jgi:GNAT superfamily N-acetyltransferase
MTLFRPASEADLCSIYEVFYANEVAGDPHPPPREKASPGLRHLLHTGTLYVAEQDGEILAFAAAMSWDRVAPSTDSVPGGEGMSREASDDSPVEDRVTFLTDLFVLPDRQSSGFGAELLRRVSPHDEHIRCTFSSTDPRALSLYIRDGMQPQWPHFCLQLQGSPRRDLSTGDVETVEAQVGDPLLMQWDAEIGGRLRPADHTYWVQEQLGTPLWLRRRGDLIGYAYVRLSAGSLYHPDACTIGPVGARTPEDATACVLAAVAWAHRRAAVLLVNVPGPHPALAPLLDVGFRITYVETFLSTAKTPFFDARRYIASGSDLF